MAHDDRKAERDASQDARKTERDARQAAREAEPNPRQAARQAARNARQEARRAERGGDRPARPGRPGDPPPTTETPPPYTPPPEEFPPGQDYPDAPMYAVEDLGNDQFKYLLTYYSEIVNGCWQGVYARGGQSVLNSRINCAYNQGGDPGTVPTNDYAEYKAGLMPIEGLNQAGVTWPPGTVPYSPPADVKQFGLDWAAWKEKYGNKAKKDYDNDA